MSLPQLRADRAHERAVQTRLILSAERALTLHVARLIRRAGQDAAGDLTASGTDAAIAALRKRLSVQLRASLTALARQFAARVARASKAASGLELRAFEDYDQSIADYIERITARRVVQIGDAMRDTIRHVIDTGLADDLGQDEIARMIRDATDGEIGLRRAQRIARTETHSAAMHGQQAAAEASPLVYEREWLATEDERTRPSHAEANGQRVAVDEPFVVGGAKLRYPGDPAGPAYHVVNCRCVMQMVPVAAGGAQ